MARAKQETVNPSVIFNQFYICIYTELIEVILTLKHVDTLILKQIFFVYILK